jgi:hypothetical protein
MNDAYKHHIEVLSREIAEHRKIVRNKEWLRREFFKLDNEINPPQSPIDRWARPIKRAIALWLLE